MEVCSFCENALWNGSTLVGCAIDVTPENNNYCEGFDNIPHGCDYMCDCDCDYTCDCDGY